MTRRQAEIIVLFGVETKAYERKIDTFNASTAELVSIASDILGAVHKAQKDLHRSKLSHVAKVFLGLRHAMGIKTLYLENDDA